MCPSQRTKPSFPTSSNASSNAASAAASPVPEAADQDDEEPQSDIDPGAPASWHIAHVNRTHRLIFNKYCIYRPQYILLTASPAHLQTTPLDLTDFKAAWTALNALERLGPHYLIFNCARQAGGSRMHKHMQLFEQEGEAMLPDRILLDPTGEVAKNIPYRYSLHALPKHLRDGNTDEVADTLLRAYTSHVEDCTKALDGAGFVNEDEGVIPHNIVLTKRWLITIPRRAAGNGSATANAAGFMGLVWVPDEAVVDRWKRLGPTQNLAELGVPA